jgi:hypothetical protein
MPTLSGAVSRIFLFLKAVRYGRHEGILPEFLLTVKNLSFAPGGPCCSIQAWRRGKKWRLPRGDFPREQSVSLMMHWRKGCRGGVWTPPTREVCRMFVVKQFLKGVLLPPLPWLLVLLVVWTCWHRRWARKLLLGTIVALQEQTTDFLR